MCWNGQNITTLCIKKQYTWKHVMTIKGFILDICHGLNGNKFRNTINVYSPEQKIYTFDKNDWNCLEWKEIFESWLESKLLK